MENLEHYGRSLFQRNSFQRKNTTGMREMAGEREKGASSDLFFCFALPNVMYVGVMMRSSVQ